ncbi:MAG: methylenetetrahydrofolate dehydrogenase / methenyltetrahydrofolate cyclohydrolase [Actinomycetota bacterium]|jgi:methylenetetrahydrofolate dehydrogenase (NADP+)/methenyltetrahydrofolate cyclohydrolase|nr:methylenetetrahydrofolate dehydrogenase / methenyltetrahydrofolate cyclohydrolase [Actinomycetota bacterium]
MPREDVIYMPGGPVADAVLADVALRVEALQRKGKTVGLGTILVGGDPASARYVAKKHATSEAHGITSHHVELPADASLQQVLDAVHSFNDDPAVDGYLVQTPLPNRDHEGDVLEAIDPDKDADGMHPTNIGRLAYGIDGPIPCTPAGIVAMLQHYQVPVEGRHVVVVGRGPTLGRPVSLLLGLKRPGANAAVTNVHTGVPNIADYTRQADVLIGAAGVPSIIQPEMVKPGAVVVNGGLSFRGKKEKPVVMPDVDEACEDVAGWITPRLGGVGVTTVAMLLQNTVSLAEKHAARS